MGKGKNENFDYVLIMVKNYVQTKLKRTSMTDKFVHLTTTFNLRSIFEKKKKKKKDVCVKFALYHVYGTANL